MSDFNHQNVIFNLSFTKVDEGVKASIHSSYGLYGDIVSSRVSVVSLDSHLHEKKNCSGSLYERINLNEM